MLLRFEIRLVLRHVAHLDYRFSRTTALVSVGEEAPHTSVGRAPPLLASNKSWQRKGMYVSPNEKRKEIWLKAFDTDTVFLGEPEHGVLSPETK